MPSKTVCDTMIWYYLGNGYLDYEKYKSEGLTSTFINVLEVATSFNLIKIVDDVRNAIRSMMIQSKVTRFDPPLIYLARLADNEFNYDTLKDNQDIFNATQIIAQGGSIADDKVEQFGLWLQSREKPLEDFAQLINSRLEKIRKQIFDKKKHAAEDATVGNRKFVDHLVRTTTDGKFNLDNLDWSRVELFEKTLGSFFKELELSSNMRFQINDLFDLLNLVYVEQGDKYFTLEKRWIVRIKNAGLQQYLR